MSDMADKGLPAESQRQLGKQIRELRLQQGVSQTALSKMSGLSRDTLHRLERGDVVDVRSLLKAVRALGYEIRLTPTAPIRASDMRRRFAHIHEEGE
jgi:transcriptional regulator with XRE-family HTH domain